MKNKQVFIIAGAAFVVLVALVFFIFGRGFSPTGQDKQAIEHALTDDQKASGIVNTFRMEVDPGDLSIHEGLNKQWTHILLLGTDGWHSSLNEGRTDAMIVASINSRTKEIKLTSLVRDMLVDIPGMKSQQRINTANSFGGPYLAVKTVNELLELNISSYCLINYVGFGNLIDLVGGLELDISQSEARIVGVEDVEGKQHLNGWQTLTYAQIRKLDNNFGRNERQRHVMSAFLDKAISMGGKDMLALVPEALRYVSTNLSTAEILALMPVALSSKNEIQMLSLPPEHAYHYGQEGENSSVIVFDLDKTRETFNNFIDGKQPVQAGASGE